MHIIKIYSIASIVYVHYICTYVRVLYYRVQGSSLCQCIPAVYYDGLVFSTTLDFLNDFDHCQQAGTAAGRFVSIPTMIMELSHLVAIISLHVIKIRTT